MDNFPRSQQLKKKKAMKKRGKKSGKNGPILQT